MKNIRLLLLGIFSLAITACGGGSSSDGSGGGGTVYSGTETLTLSFPGIPSQTGTFAITITISEGRVTITDGDISGTAPLSADGKNYTVPVSFSISESGITCQFNIIHTGKISGTTTSGTISGSSPCRGPGGIGTITASGAFTATQSGAAKMIVGESFSGAVKSFVRDSL